MINLLLDALLPDPNFDPGAYFMEEFGWTIPVVLVILVVVVVAAIIRRRRNK